MIIPFLHSIVARQFRRHGILRRRAVLGSGPLHYYELLPERPEGTLVLVHGLGTSSSTWVNILPHLQRLHVLAPDLPGFGFSPGLPGVPTIGDYVEVFEEFVNAVVRGPFKLLGHSMGGWVTMRYAVKHRDRINHLILVNTAGVYHSGVDSLRDAFILHSTKDTRKLLDRIWVHYPWYFRPFTPLVFEDLVSRKVPQIVAGVKETDFVNSDLSKLTMPVSVIWGMGDRLISSDALRILEERLPARRVYTIQNSGHVPQLQAPGEFLSILEKVLHDSIL